MKDIIKLSVSLGLVSTLAAAALALAYSGTESAIKEAQTKQQSVNLKKVLPEYGNTPLSDRIEVDTVVFYRARSAEHAPVTAVAGQAAAKGFGGPVRILVGINLDGSVRKVLVTKHSETPGLGTQVTDRQRRVSVFELMKGGTNQGDADAVPPNGFLDQYERESFAFDGDVECSIGGTVTPISGATISSKAVNDAIKKVAAVFAANKADILK
ncbi:MAG: RnfABCDGE type electron transport complex subunit G [Lentisphaeria bacterium]|nr:RnfABCDGE type electron transport complex subunit G [Lentisphaeria bacterium]